jgi:DtxR family transcriptional regulator, manganese transport regulator
MSALPKDKSGPARLDRSTLRQFQERFQRTRKDHSQETAEDYVELIDHLIRERGEARLVDIAELLGVSSVTANQSVGRLQRDGLVSKEPYRSVFLTKTGQELADRGRHRHEIVIRFLCAIGVPTDQAHIDAEGIEHHVSAITLQRMSEFIQRTGEWRG